MVDASKVWEEDPSALPGISEADFQEFEAKYQIRLPPFLKEMYRLQNGGEIKNADEELVFFPIGIPDAIYGQMRSLQDYASAYAPSSLTSIYLDWIDEEFQDTGRVIVIADSYGHVKYVLDYNASNEGEEPPVVSLDFEGCDKNQIATSFEKWMGELSLGTSEQSIDRTESRPSFDWDDIEESEVLYRSSFRDTFKSDGAVEEIENVLCKSRERGLIHYVRRTVNEQVVTLDCCSIAHGVLDSKLIINRCRPEPANTFGLKLESLKPGDISWVTNELDSPGRWITNKTNGPPYACTVESQDRDSLERLATALRGKGFAGTPEPHPEDLLDPGMKKLWEMFTGTMGVIQEKLFQTLESKPPKSKYDSDPDPDLPDIDTVDPAMRSEDENLQESIRIIRSWAGQVRKIQSVEDAEAFVQNFRVYIDRLIRISRHQGLLTKFTSKLSTVSDSLREEIQDLMNRDGRAYIIIDSHKREVEWDAVRSTRLGDKIDEYLDRYNDSMSVVLECLKGILNNNAFEQVRYQASLEELENRDSELRGLKEEMDAFDWGWILGKRKFHPAYIELDEQINILMVKQRTLFKQHRDDFEKLKNLLML